MLLEPFLSHVCLGERKVPSIELIETALSDDEVFGEPKADSVIYPEETVPFSAQEVIRS